MAQVSATLNSRYELAVRLEIERLHLKPLSVDRIANCEPLVARLCSTNTIEVRSATYSVPSRLIAQQLTVHLRHDRLELNLRRQHALTLSRLYARKSVSGPLRRIDFHHVIDSFRRKLMALLRDQLQDDLLPRESWRQLWRKLLTALPPDEAVKVKVDVTPCRHQSGRTGRCGAVPAPLAPWRRTEPDCAA